MVKFMTDGDPPLLGLGLSTGNLQKLANGHPIKINADELATGHDIIIFWGPTETARNILSVPNSLFCHKILTKTD